LIFRTIHRIISLPPCVSIEKQKLDLISPHGSELDRAVVTETMTLHLIRLQNTMPTGPNTVLFASALSPRILK
jgi:hypothetical protein